MENDNREGANISIAGRVAQFILTSSPINKVLWLYIAFSFFDLLFLVTFFYSKLPDLVTKTGDLWFAVSGVAILYFMFAIYTKPLLGMESKYGYLIEKASLIGEKGKVLRELGSNEKLFQPIIQTKQSLLSIRSSMRKHKI